MRHLFKHPFQNNWFCLDYLALGDCVQRTARNVIRQSGLFTVLKCFEPVLCGTIPLGCNIESSDLDILCQVDDLSSFEEFAVRSFAAFRRLQVKNKVLRGGPAVLVRFTWQEFKFEIVAQKKPVTEQYAYAHMLAEAWLLYEHGPRLRAEIKRLKENALSTEVAFARLFNIVGEPYEMLYQLYMDMKKTPKP